MLDNWPALEEEGEADEPVKAPFHVIPVPDYSCSAMSLCGAQPSRSKSSRQ